MQNQYIINGKKYSTTDSIVLCVGKTPCLDPITLYRSKKGIFFIVTEDTVTGTKAKIMEEQEAHEFMSKNETGINIENYEKVFGKVEEG